MGAPNQNKALLLYCKIDDKCSPNFLALKRQKITLRIEVIKSIAAMETVMVNSRPKLQEALEGKDSNGEMPVDQYMRSAEWIPVIVSKVFTQDPTSGLWGCCWWGFDSWCDWWLRPTVIIWNLCWYRTGVSLSNRKQNCLTAVALTRQLNLVVPVNLVLNFCHQTSVITSIPILDIRYLKFYPAVAFGDLDSSF